jgi:hypothetical protein
MQTLDDFKKKIRRKEIELLKLESDRKNMLDLLEEKKLTLEDEKEERQANFDASIYLKKQAKETREQSLNLIEGMTTKAIKPSYGDDYEFLFKDNNADLESGNVSTVKITPSICSRFLDDVLVNGIIDGRGGGVAETVSVILRLAVLKLYNYNGATILDETWASLSADEKLENSIKWIVEYNDQTNGQIILVTHRAEFFTKVSDSIYLCEKTEDNQAIVTKVTHEQIMDRVFK